LALASDSLTGVVAGSAASVAALLAALAGRNYRCSAAAKPYRVSPTHDHSPGLATQVPTVVARLNERAQPVDRGSRYEDVLDGFLKDRELGEVVGGGSLLAATGEIEYCEIEIDLRNDSEETLATVANALELLGAPKGSKLIVSSDAREVPFGKNEGLAIYLNGTELPDHVYAECDSNFVYSEFNRLLEPEGSVHSHWQGPRETALYVYGASASSMRSALAQFINTYPLCQRARIVQIS
jgi:hypothetical protein